MVSECGDPSNVSRALIRRGVMLGRHFTLALRLDTSVGDGIRVITSTTTTTTDGGVSDGDIGKGDGAGGSVRGGTRELALLKATSAGEATASTASTGGAGRGGESGGNARGDTRGNTRELALLLEATSAGEGRRGGGEAGRGTGRGGDAGWNVGGGTGELTLHPKATGTGEATGEAARGRGKVSRETRELTLFKATSTGEATASTARGGDTSRKAARGREAGEGGGKFRGKARELALVRIATSTGEASREAGRGARWGAGGKLSWQREALVGRAGRALGSRESEGTAHQAHCSGAGVLHCEDVLGWSIK